jgi:hypothetical protein
MKRIAAATVVAVFLCSAASSGAASLAQKNAIASAKQYLSFTAFSRLGLISQLDSSAVGFSKTLATYAVNHITVNWDTEAAKSARSYLKLEPFSCSGLVGQLDSSAVQFTKAQAEYGAKKVGLC